MNGCYASHPKDHSVQLIIITNLELNQPPFATKRVKISINFAT